MTRDTSDLPKRRRSPLRRLRRKVIVAVLLAAVIAGMWLGSFLGLIPGVQAPSVDGLLQTLENLQDVPALRQADSGPPAAPPPPCQIYLNSQGLTVDEVPATLDQVVDSCRAAGKAKVRATGGARAGTYDDLLGALREADIAIMPD